MKTGCVWPWRSRTPRRWLLAIVLLAALLRLIGLGSASLWYDEGASLYLGQYVATPTALFDSAKNTEPPINAIMTAVWSGLLETVSPTKVTDTAHDFLLRLLPWFFGVLNCALVYRVTLVLYQSAPTALCAALLFAIAPFQIHYAQELRVYGLYTTLSLLAVWSMRSALSKNRLRDWVGLITTLTLLMYSHYFSMWLIFTLNVAFVLCLGKYKHLFWRWTAANTLVMLLIAPALYRAFVMHAEVQDIEYAWYPNPTWKMGLITFKTFFAGFGPSVWAYRPLFLICLGLWLRAVWPKDSNSTAILLVTCLTWVPIFGCVWVWSRADFSFYEHRLFLVSGVAAIMGVARGIVLLKRPGLVALGLVVVLTLPGLLDHYRGRLHTPPMHRIAMWDKVDFRSAARVLESEWRKGDRLVYTSHFSAYSMFHYFPRDQVRLGWDHNDETIFIKTMGHEALLREHKLMPIPKEQGIAGASRIWLLTTHGMTFEWQPTTTRIRDWLSSVGTKEETLDFDGVKLERYKMRGNR